MIAESRLTTAFSSDEPDEEPPSGVRSRAGKRLSIVVPMYNEGKSIHAFFDRVRSVLDQCRVIYEVVCVDDGSVDNTAALIMAQRSVDPRVKLVRLARNFGKESALTAGLVFASGDIVVPIDADLQDPPDLIAAFLDRWEQGYDVVYGVRSDRRSDGWFKRLSAKGFYRIFNRLSDTAIPVDTGDFRLMDRKVVDAVNALPERNRFMKGLFAWVGYSQIGVPYVRPSRKTGMSAWSAWSLWNFALDAITAFSSLPLRIWSYIGAALSSFAFIYAIIVVAKTVLTGREVPGYASLMVALLFFSSVQMLALGILGEYVARIYSEVKGRPLYIVSHKAGFER